MAVALRQIHEHRAADEREGEDLQELFWEYRRTRNPELHTKITSFYMSLVPAVARRYARSDVSLEDLIQVGYIGLINAVSQFDPARGVKFETYARHLIAGEIRHYLRDFGGVVRRPRWLYALNKKITAAVFDLHHRLGRPPLLSEIAEAVNITEEGVLEVLRARETVRVASLEELRENGDGEIRINRESIVHRHYATLQLPVEDRIFLMEAIERLSELQRKVIYYLFFLDLTQVEAAKRLGISQKHVSRVMHAALVRLREMLTA
ncbi:MAG: sigma-70 family RNA polymerase sigma factor [Armatimonadota bacterium]|nr:sigma-70 family RNA polymerase sigma factor [Armatimonadota bacterium]